MTYLDVSPMVIALRTTPEEFELHGRWLHHSPSRHDFTFDKEGHVRISARCNCAMLMVRSDQEKQLFDTFQQWRTEYWRPLEINREFASHFPPRSFLRQKLIDFAAWAHRRLAQRRLPEHAHDGQAISPAE